MSDNINAPIPSGTTEPLRFVELATGKKVGTSRIDQGVGTAEDLYTTANPLRVLPPQTVNQTINAQVSVPTTAGGTVVAAANSSRKGLLLMSDTLFYVAVGGDPTSASWPVQPGQFWSPPVNMTGEVKCLSSSGTINVNVFEC